MQLVSSETSLIIAGAWNLAILTPVWVLQHGLKKPLDGSNIIQTYLPATPGGIFDFPRYVLNGLSFSVRPDLLFLSPSESMPEDMSILEDVAASMLEELNHTPVTGIGHNFVFRKENPEAIDLNIFTDSRQDLTDITPNEWQPASSSISTSFKNTDETIIVNIHRECEANMLIVKFNFHHPIKSIDEALIVLKGENGLDRMSQNLVLAKSLMAKLYGEIENE